MNDDLLNRVRNAHHLLNVTNGDLPREDALALAQYIRVLEKIILKHVEAVLLDVPVASVLDADEQHIVQHLWEEALDAMLKKARSNDVMERLEWEDNDND